MASISTDKNGNRKIQFGNGNGERKSIYLGTVRMKTARDLKVRVEALNSAKGSRSSLDNETAEWVANIEDDLAGKLADVRTAATVAGFSADAIEAGLNSPDIVMYKAFRRRYVGEVEHVRTVDDWPDDPPLNGRWHGLLDRLLL